MKSKLKIELLSRILDIPNVHSRKSRYSDDEAIFIGKREIGHFHSADEIDIRLTRSEIKKMAVSKKEDFRFIFDGPSPDWLAIKFKNESDLKFIVKTFEVAVKANRDAAQ